MPTYTAVANSTGQPSAPAPMDVINVTFAAPADNYLTPGYAIALQNRIGQGKVIDWVQCESYATATGIWDGRIWKYNITSGRLQAFTTVPAEIADATDVSAVTVRLVVYSH